MNDRTRQQPHLGDGEEHATGAGRNGNSRDGSAHTYEHHSLVAAHAGERNTLLRALPLDDYRQLVSRMTSMRLTPKESLIEPNVPIRNVYFPRVGVCSMLAEQEGNPTIEVGTIGPEGFVGIPVLLGGESMPYRIIVQMDGDAWRLPSEVLRALAVERPLVRTMLLRFAQCFLNQLSQSVACNRLHTLEERCARWLLMTHDRVHGDTFDMTQEFLSMMLGVHRPGVSVAMGMLQNAGILRYARGRVLVLERERLEDASCDCYTITRADQQRLLMVPEE